LVDIQLYGEVENIVRDRLLKAAPEIQASLNFIASGNPLAAEPQSARLARRIEAKTGVSPAAAKMMTGAIRAAAEPVARIGTSEKVARPEAIQGSTLDFVGVAFLERGRRAADAVGRVAFRDGRAQGTGFMVAPRLFLTNHHVIESVFAAGRMQVQFDYEYDLSDRERDITSFFFDPDLCFVSDDIHGLDFTLLGVGERRSGSRGLEEFGYLPLSDANDKHALGEIANVIQHPDGRYKELVLRENHLVSRDETAQVLHYVADTEQGSSGSPVFNNEWQTIALHHWGGPWREVMGASGQPLSREVNEGIRISAIVGALRGVREGSSAAAVSRALDLWDAPVHPSGNRRNSSRTPEENSESQRAPAGNGPASRHNPDGSVTWTFPIEISVAAPLIGGRSDTRGQPPADKDLPTPAKPGTHAEAANWKTEDFSNRGGYEPGFIQGFVVPLPRLAKVSWRPAVNQLAQEDDDPHELRYNHFSIVMNADRRLCGFTAVNIDGARIKAVIRDTKTVIDDPSLADLGVESLGDEGAEASDDFRPDRRILSEEQMNRPFYEKQKVAGFPDPQSPARIARIFQKGHIVLRGDPAWGATHEEAQAAERDTFFYTNAAPQVGFFNQGSEMNRPGSKGKLRWRAVESYVLRNAVTMRSRVTVFAGPVFDDANDPLYRFESRVPMRFWKIAVWSDGSALRAIALLADQRPVLEIMPEAIGAEAFTDSEELARVTEFLSTVKAIETLTGLDFGAPIRKADIRSGASSAAPALDLDPESLRDPPVKPLGSGKGGRGRKRPS
jgi:endonuclease G, mitochondrial